MEQQVVAWRSYTFTSGGAASCVSASPPVLNDWTHVVCTAKNNDSLNLYLNGLSAATTSLGGLSLWTGGSDWWSCRISGGTVANFTGQIAELAIWNKKLTNLEIYALASGARGLPPTIQGASLIAYCEMNNAADGVTLVGNWGDYTGTPTQNRTGAPIGKNLDLPLRADALPTANMLANWKADAISASNNDPLATWVDSSGRSQDGFQSDNGRKPVYKTNVINGLPAVRFDSQFFNIPITLFGSATAAEVYAVVKIDSEPPAAADLTGLWTFGGQNAERMHYPWSGNSTIYDNFCTTIRKTTVDPTPALTSWRVYAARSSSGNWENDLDGVNLYTTASNTFQSATNSGNFIGKSLSGSPSDYWLVGYIAEIVLYGSTLTAAQKIQVLNYFNQKYALGIT